MVSSQKTLNTVFVQISELCCLFYTLACGESLELVTLNCLNHCFKWRMLVAQSPFPPFLAVFVFTASGLDSSLFCHHEPQRCVARETRQEPSIWGTDAISIHPTPFLFLVFFFFALYVFCFFFVYFINCSCWGKKKQSKTKTNCSPHPLEKRKSALQTIFKILICN